MITYGELERMGLALVKLRDCVALSGATKLQLVRFLRAAGPLIRDYEVRRGELAREHGNPQEGNPGIINIPPENMKAFSDALGPLARMAAGDLPELALSAADIDAASLTCADVEVLSPFFAELENSPPPIKQAPQGRKTRPADSRRDKLAGSR